MATFVMVCVFGGLGAVTRFIVDTSVRRWWKNRLFPLATFMINCLAGFCAGIARGRVCQWRGGLCHAYAVCGRFPWRILHVFHLDQRGDGVASRQAVRHGWVVLPAVDGGSGVVYRSRLGCGQPRVLRRVSDCSLDAIAALSALLCLPDC